MIPREDEYEEVLQSILKQPEGLGTLEGSYFHYDTKKKKWIRSGNASGVGKNVCFNGREGTHVKNARSLDQMRKHHFLSGTSCQGGGKHWRNRRVF